MRSFTAILLALSLPLYALAAHGNARRHTGLAHRARGDVLDKRDFQARLTYYDIDVGLTACGGRYPASAFVVALNGAMFGSGYPGPHCGQTIVLTANGKTTTAVVVDKCPGCPNGGLDLTRGLFHFFADLSVGVIQGSWHYAGSGDDQSTKQPEPTTTTHKPKPTPTPTPTPTPEEPSPSPKHTTSSTPEPSPSPSTTSTSSKESTTTSTSTSTTTSTTTSKPHSSTTSSPSPSSTSSLDPDGLAQPAGVIPSDGQSPQNLESLNEAITNLGTLVEACQ
ncbi:RlpA-like double-psi beta-barrel-protein domain-containing protein-containing protein [Lactarius vividus]|nr:RlpA-like double-psi beta-barrel-protein domain-containing protein-containing protein [Lactarius vividus]